MSTDDHTRSPTLLWLIVLGAPFGLAAWAGLWWLIGMLIELWRRRYG